MEKKWTDGEINTLKGMWNESTSFEIGVALDRTRNSVIGAAHRLGLCKKARTENAKGGGQKKRKRVRRASFMRMPREYAPFQPLDPILLTRPLVRNGVGVRLVDLERQQCREVIGVGVDGMARFCGKQTGQRLDSQVDAAYCPKHAALNYRLEKKMQKTLTINLPLPPSVNALYWNKKGKGRIKTKTYKAWLSEADVWMLPQMRFIAPVTGPCEVKILLPKVRGDISNRIKAVEDYLVSREITGDDRHNRKVSVEVKESAVCCEVLVTAFEI